MALDVSAGKGSKLGVARPEMNVTPLVDVVLVLLIIFMVITPLLGKQFWVHYPDLDDAEDQSSPEEGQGPVVVSVAASGHARINREIVPDEDLAGRIRRVLAARGSRTIFFDASDRVEFGRAVEVLDLARGGGATTIAMLTESID